MKKLILATLATALLAGNAMASDTSSTVNFKGKVVEQTCKIQAGSQDQTVQLNTVPTSSLNAAGKTAMPTPFSIALTDCTQQVNGAIKVRAYFHSAANIDTQNAYTLKNTATTSPATNVNIQLLNKDGITPITPGKEGTIDVANKIVGIVDGVKAEDITTATPTLHYIARYYATGAATAGDVTSSINFDLTYE